MIVSRSQLKQLRSRRDSQVKYESKQTNQNTIQVEDHQNTHSFHSRGALSQMISNTLTKKYPTHNNEFSSNHKLQTSSISKPSYYQQSRKKYDKMSFDIELTKRNLKQFIVALPNSINVRQIYSLNLSQNNIKQILPTVLVPFQSLRQLNLTKNNIQKISFPYNKMKLKTLEISHNSLMNLNLQHLKYLESVNASHNKLIFITLPQSLRLLNLNHNMLSNMYFIEKCEKIENISINFNFVYDLTFSSINQLDRVVKKQVQCPRFFKLKKVDCSHNKISHLNGFFNIKYVKELSLEFNQLCLNRQNLNELFLLEEIETLNMCQNPLQCTYSLPTALDFIVKKLTHLKLLNSQPKELFKADQKQFSSAESRKQEDKKEECSLNDQSSINENSEDVLNSGEKPFRLFLDEDSTPQSPKKKQVKRSKSTKEWIYTLGDTEPKPDEDDSQIFKLMTLCNEHNESQLNYHKANSQSSQEKPKEKRQNQSKKLTQLEEQVLNKNKQIELSLSNIEYSNGQVELDYESRNILKMIFQMSFIPPCPIKHSSKSQVVAKRLDQDEDEYLLFSKLFKKKKGILYLKKIYHVEETNPIFGFDENTPQYELSFFNHPKVEQVYKEMSRNHAVLKQALESIKSPLQNISHFLSPVPNSFGCYHILIRNLKGKRKAFEEKNFAPLCYLVQTRNI